MKRLLIIFVEIGAFLIMALAAVLFWCSHYIDTEEFRQQFAEVVELEIGQPVSLDGELNIALYPTLSLEILNLEIDGDPEYGVAPLVSFDKLLVSVRLMPLLSRQIEVRSVIVEGMEINIVRAKDDTFNWQSLIDKQLQGASRELGTGSPINGISLSELEVVDATVNYIDDVEVQSYKLSGVGLRTGEIVPGAKIPFTANSSFAWKNGGVTSDFILKGIFTSDDDGIKLKDSTIYATVGGDFLPPGANPGEMTAQVDVDMSKHAISLEGLRIRFMGLLAEGSVRSADLSKELKAVGSVRVHEFKPADIISRYAPKAPVKSVDGLQRGSVVTDFVIDESGFSFNKLKVSLDDLTVLGTLVMKGYGQPVFDFDLQGGMVDLDRYLPLFMTGTPFIWDDFNLPFFGSFRGKGAIKASGFKVLDIPIANVNLNLTADDKSIQANAVAVRTGHGDISAQAEFRIGRQAHSSIPTFGANLKVTTESTSDGFDFLNIKPLKTSGAGKLHATISVADMECPPKVESIGILRYVSGDVSLSMEQGEAGYFKDDASSYSLEYSKAECALKIAPIPADGVSQYGYNVDSSLRLNTGGVLRAASATAVGPLIVDIETGRLQSPGLDMKGTAAGALVTDQQTRFSAAGKVGFDTEKGEVQIDSATIRALETTVKGSARITDLKTSFKANGEIDVPGANVRRIVYLLSKFALRTGDPDALKNISLKANFTANKEGFHLSEMNGSLDGMSIKGNIIGKGYVDTHFVGSLAGGVLDIDRFIPDSEERRLQAERQGKEYKAAAVELPFAFLRWLNVNVKVWLEGLKLVDIRATNVSGNIQAHNGAINVSNVKGIIHGGPLKAGWVGEVSENSLTTHLKLNVENMKAGDLLKDMAGRDYVRGQADVDIDVKSHGRTDDDIILNLDGQVRCRVTNGSFKFTGYDVRATASEDDDSRQLVSSSDPRTRRTVFQKAVAYFAVEKGVFTVDKFRVEAPPLLQSYGKGNFSLPDNTIDLTIRNDFVAVPSVTMHLEGKLSDPEVNIPKAEIVTDTVKNILSLPEKSFQFLRDLFQ